MKTSEILLASGVLAVVAGAGSAFAARAFLEPGRATQTLVTLSEDEPQSAPASELAATVRATAKLVEELRLENSSLRGRLAALESLVGEEGGTRTALAAVQVEAPRASSSLEVASALVSGEITPAFVASVDEALALIEARKDAEREARRKELQALRIEERVTKLQAELGLNNRQTSDLRTTLIDQDERREALFASMRDESGDPRSAREGFRAIRDETEVALQAFLSPAQFEAYKKSEESESGRRGFGDFGGGPGGPPRDGGGGQRGQREGR